MSAHVLSMKTHLVVFGTLIVLTALTVAVAQLDLGEWNTIVALLIAASKGLVVILWFMHVKFSSRLTWLFAGTGFVWLLIMILLLSGDYVARGWVQL